MKFLIVFLLFAFTFAQCPRLNTVKLDIAKYQGAWFEIATTPWARRTFQRDCLCTKARYTPEASRVKVDNTCNLRTVDGKLQRSIGHAIARNASEPGKLSVSFGWGMYGDYWVIDTDYTSYSAVWSCSSVFGVKAEFLWILSRTQVMDVNKYRNITQNAARITGYDIKDLTLTTQQGCTYPDRR